jgi:hypothetical protein
LTSLYVTDSDGLTWVRLTDSNRLILMDSNGLTLLFT